MYRVYDDILPPDLVDDLESIFLDGDGFPWRPMVKINDEGLKENTYKTVNCQNWEEVKEKYPNAIQSCQLGHNIWSANSIRTTKEFADLAFAPVQHASNNVSYEWGYKEFSFLRMKANLLLNSAQDLEEYHNVPHVDTTSEHLVFLYYVNDSDGDTYIWDRYGEELLTRVSPERGRILVFDGFHYHASSPPSKSEARIVINSNVRCS